MITDEKWEKLKERMEALGIRERDIDEHFIRGSGSGGQKINKTSSCVQLVHHPFGIDIRCQKTRSQADNRYWARRELCDRIEEKKLG
ncbi:MAG: peptide chain release factor-like protein, partial [Verrucomicrobia bacterium]|nr:peptide chain release factor-like protein [Verrucomicrobiota bacterium]